MKKLIRIFLILVLFVLFAGSGCENSTSPTTEENKIVAMDRIDYVDVVYKTLNDLQDAKVYKEVTSYSWNRKEEIKKIDPDMVVLHFSCFYDPARGEIDYQEKFLPFLKYMASSTGPIFLIYSWAELTEAHRQTIIKDANIASHLIAVFGNLDYFNEQSESLQHLKEHVKLLLEGCPPELLVPFSAAGSQIAN